MVCQKGVHVDGHERVKDLNAEPARQQDADAIIYLFPLLALPFLGTVILWILTLRIHATAASISIGVAIGLLLPIVDSRIWMLCFPGFESLTAFFTSAVVISLPNALGGGVAGWLRTRVRPV